MRESYSVILSIVAGFFVAVVTVGFAMIQSPEILRAPERESISIPHTIEGRTQCDGCHGIRGIRPYPVRHMGWSNESCKKCHLPAVSHAIEPVAITPAPSFSEASEAVVKNHSAEKNISDERKISPITHQIEAWEDCIKCHSVDNNIMPAPADHTDWGNNMCTKCHVVHLSDNNR